MSSPVTPGQTHMQALWQVRKYELEIALKYFPPTISESPIRLLELGAGTGQQAQNLSDYGYEVTALDLPSSSYRDTRVFDVGEYDGVNIPALDEEFDVVFSSNVLEHVVKIDEVLAETFRVLKPGGIAVHLVPSPQCRVWSIPAHYIWLCRRIYAKLFVKHSGDKSTNYPRTPQSSKEWLGTLFPLRHGERGNTLAEIYYFSAWYWKKKFIKQGFSVKQISNNGIFYTMANSLGSAIPIEIRESMAIYLGASCNLYLLEKK